MLSVMPSVSASCLRCAGCNMMVLRTPSHSHRLTTAHYHCSVSATSSLFSCSHPIALQGSIRARPTSLVCSAPPAYVMLLALQVWRVSDTDEATELLSKYWNSQSSDADGTWSWNSEARCADQSASVDCIQLIREILTANGL